MKYRLLGRNTGLRVSELALGTANFGTGWGHGAEREETQKIFDAYVNAGGNFIDTANGYQNGQSEQIVGDLIKSNRDHFVLATKYTFPASPEESIALRGNSRKSMISSVEASLKRLKTDRIDLLWAHVSDQVTPTEELLRGFDDLARSGKILYAGLSNFPAWRIARAATLAEIHRSLPIMAIQTEYSLIERSADRELLPMAEALGLGAMLWSPLAGGLLTGKYRQSAEGRLKGLGGKVIHTERTERDTAIVDTVLSIAAEKDVQPLQVAMAWILNKAAQSPTSLIPILGPRTSEQLTANMNSLSVVLSTEEVRRLEDASRLDLGSPYAMIETSFDQIHAGIALEHPRTPVS